MGQTPRIRDLRRLELFARCRPFIFAVVFAALLFLGDSLCLSQAIAGVPCPGCGSTRAVIALFHGDISGAVKWHPLIFLTLAMAPYFIARHAISRISRSPRFSINAASRFGQKPARLGSKPALLISSRAETIAAACVTSLYLIVYIIRMIMYFPRVEPMVPLETSLFRRTLSLLMDGFR